MGVAIVAVVTSHIISSEYSAKLKDKDVKIEELQKSLKEAAEASKTTQTKIVTVTPPSKGQETSELDCIACHELDKTKAFHVPQTIMKIEATQDKRRRVCIDCHGPLGPPWSADKQLTELKDITYDPNVGLNGIFDFSNKVPHGIHKRKLEAGILNCEFCHVKGEEFFIPQADVNKGQVLVCQNCMAHPEDGNYITVHVEMKGYKCTVCHTGDLVKIHGDKTAKLGGITQNISLKDLSSRWKQPAEQ